eukprot:TRINITY_DN3396_c2_g2_i1.p1 TRINITY_DN3396_c2_g2~~TRINITY_DN3396_c2_g2_i1.p1  ORF type:complete len:753 (-),score=199.34 TRINITY_DN3396_c2_g2_i1:108-2327(-)
MFYAGSTRPPMQANPNMNLRNSAFDPPFKRLRMSGHVGGVKAELEEVAGEQYGSVAEAEETEYPVEGEQYGSVAEAEETEYPVEDALDYSDDTYGQYGAEQGDEQGDEQAQEDPMDESDQMLGEESSSGFGMTVADQVRTAHFALKQARVFRPMLRPAMIRPAMIRPAMVRPPPHLAHLGLQQQLQFPNNSAVQGVTPKTAGFAYKPPQSFRPAMIHHLEAPAIPAAPLGHSWGGQTGAPALTASRVMSMQPAREASLAVKEEPSGREAKRSLGAGDSMRCEEVQKGMLVWYDGECRAWVDNTFPSLDEFWLMEEESKCTVFGVNNDGRPAKVRPFKASELTFTGEWTDQIEVERSIDIDPKVMEKLLQDGNFEEELEELTNASVRIEKPEIDILTGKVVIGPGPPREVHEGFEAASDRIKALEAQIIKEEAQEAARARDEEEEATRRIQAEAEAEFAAAEAKAKAQEMDFDSTEAWAKEMNENAGQEQAEKEQAENEQAEVKEEAPPKKAEASSGKDEAHAQEEDSSEQQGGKNESEDSGGWSGKSWWNKSSWSESWDQGSWNSNSWNRGWWSQGSWSQGNDEEAAKEAGTDEGSAKELAETGKAETKAAEAGDGVTTPPAALASAAVAETNRGDGNAQQREQAPAATGPAEPPKKKVLDWLNDQDQFSHLPKLPPDWIRIKKSGSDTIYFFNTRTGASTFDEPLPDGWVMVKSKSSGKTYYWNEQLNKNQFEKPTLS